MTQLPPEPLIPNNTLITRTPEEGKALAIMLARHSIHAMQKEVEVLVSGRAKYAQDPNSLIAASHVIAVAFATSDGTGSRSGFFDFSRFSAANRCTLHPKTR